ncbi:MAG: glycosyltransferase family 39 protein [Patescibacteria group bacterium]
MNFSKRIPFVFIISTLFVSFALRFYALGQVPNGLSPDEVDVGYNAFSIIKTHKDVYGRAFPLFFQSLDDYKAGLPIYLSVIGIKLFGLSDYSIRAIPALFGALTPILFFFFAKLLYPEKKKFPFVIMILATFEPWGIAISRAMIFYSEYVFLCLLVLITFLIGMKKNMKNVLYVSGALLGLTPYVYYSSFIYMPLLFVAVSLIYKDFIFKNLKTCTISLLFVLVVSFPAISLYLNPQNRNRFNAISLFNPDTTLTLSIKEQTSDIEEKLPFSGYVHNRRIIYASAFLDNYFDYFNLDYLFVNAKNIRYFYTNYVGLFYLFAIPFFLFGLFKIITRRKKDDLFILALIIIGPISAAVTLGSPFPHRGLLFLIGVQVVCALGLTAFFDNFLKRKQWQYKAAIILIIFAYFLNVYFFIHQYFIHSPQEFNAESNNGAWFATVRDVMPFVRKNKSNYETIIFSWSYRKLVPGVYYAFYNKTSPFVFQSKSALWTNEPPSYRQIYDKIENIEFRPIDWENDKSRIKTLLIGYPEEFPPDVKNVVNKTYLPNGQIHLLFVEVKKD